MYFQKKRQSSWSVPFFAVIIIGTVLVVATGLIFFSLRVDTGSRTFPMAPPLEVTKEEATDVEGTYRREILALQERVQNGDRTTVADLKDVEETFFLIRVSRSMQEAHLQTLLKIQALGPEQSAVSDEVTRDTIISLLGSLIEQR